MINLSLAKIPIFCKRWTSLFAPATASTMIPASLIFISSLVSTIKLRPDLARENLALRQQLGGGRTRNRTSSGANQNTRHGDCIFKYADFGGALAFGNHGETP